MSLPAHSRTELTPDLNICRILNGMWQVSGAHGRINPDRAIASMFDYIDAGFTTWDLADHYGPAEDFIGTFRQQLRQQRGDEALNDLQAFTKWVPRPVSMTRSFVEQNVDRALTRMQVDAIDLMQFHWWDYRNPGYLDALGHLSDLQKAGKIRHLALTNFDTERLRLILDHDIAVVSNQVQFSVVDRRPLAKMTQLCKERGVSLLAYGTLCGGFLSERYLGESDPGSYGLETVSLRKYKQTIDAWGGWALFQELLQALKQIADKHGVSLANVAVRYVLQQPAVAGAIVGARLGIAQHVADNARVFEFELDEEDMQSLAPIFERSRDLLQIIGDCGDEYR